MKYIIVLIITLYISTVAFCGESVVYPNTKYTTGKMCTVSDPNFSHTYRYAEKIPYCNRDIKVAEKALVAKEYNLKRADWSKYEFDHLFPLSMGGSDSSANIWPQPLAQAHVKDRIENAVYYAMKKGKMTQKQAEEAIVNWFCQPCKGVDGSNICAPRHIDITGLDMTMCTSLKVQLLDGKQ